MTDTPAYFTKLDPPPGFSVPPGLGPKTWDGDKFDAVSTCVGSASTSSLMGTAVETDYYFTDLKMFSDLLMLRLKFSKEAFEECDEDMAASLGIVEVQAKEMLEKAEVVAKSLAAVDCYAQFQDLPEQVLSGHPDPESLLCNAEASIERLRKEATNVRSEYVQLLRRLDYLAECADVSICHALKVEGIRRLSSKGTPRYIDASTFTSFAERASEKTAQGSRTPLMVSDRLAFGIGRLAGAADVLKEPTEFWLMLHSVELDLEDMEAGLQCLALSAVRA